MHIRSLLLVLSVTVLSLGIIPTLAAQITVSPSSPEEGEIVHDLMYAKVYVTSPIQLQEVRVDIEDRTEVLTYDGEDASFKGFLDLTGLPSNDYVCVFTARDVTGNSETAEVSVILDRPPTLSITLPINYSVVHDGAIEVAASCTDQEGPCTVRAEGTGEHEIEGTGSIAGPLQIPVSRDGGSTYIHFYAVDNRGQYKPFEFTDRIFVYYETNLAWSAMPSFSAEGLICDMYNDRLFFVQDPDFIKGGWLRGGVWDRSSGDLEDIPLPPDRLIVEAEVSPVSHCGYVTTTGAVFVSDLIGGGHGNEAILDWNQGMLIDLGYLNSNFSLFAAGGYATWQRGNSLYWRALKQQETTLVTPSAVGNSGYPVAPDGRLVYNSGTSYVFDGSNSIPISNFRVRALYKPDAIYYVELPTNPQNIYRYDAPASQLLITDATSIFDVNNGWIAFGRLSITDVSQVWLLTPDGEERQITVYADQGSEVEAVGPTGELFFFHNDRRYWASPDGTIVEVSSDQGRVEWIDGGWHLILGRSAIPFNRRVTANEPLSDGLPESLSFHSVAPNPVVLTARLTFMLPNASATSLTIYDVLGRRVATLEDGTRTAGTHTITWDASSLPSGTYQAVLRTEYGLVSTPMTVLR